MSVESSRKSYADVSTVIWIGDSSVNLVSTPLKISIQNPMLLVELGNQRRSSSSEVLLWNEVERVRASEKCLEYLE